MVSLKPQQKCPRELKNAGKKRLNLYGMKQRKIKQVSKIFVQILQAQFRKEGVVVCEIKHVV